MSYASSYLRDSCQIAQIVTPAAVACCDLVLVPSFMSDQTFANNSAVHFAVALTNLTARDLCLHGFGPATGLNWRFMT